MQAELEALSGTVRKASDAQPRAEIEALTGATQRSVTLQSELDALCSKLDLKTSELDAQPCADRGKLQQLMAEKDTAVQRSAAL